MKNVDGKFVPSHRCRNKRLYSLSIIEEEEEIRREEQCEEGCPTGELIPQISLNALEGTVGFHTMKVTGKVGKHSGGFGKHSQLSKLFTSP